MVRRTLLVLASALTFFLLSNTHATAQQKHPVIGEGKLFLRVTNPKAALAPICPRIYFNPNLDPWLGDTLYAGAEGEAKSPLPETAWLRPGQASAWLDIGTHISARPTFQTKQEYLAPVFVAALTKSSKEGLYIRVEIASGSDHRLLRRITINTAKQIKLGNSVWLGGEPLPTLGLLVPTSSPFTSRILTLEEAAAQQLSWVKSFGPKPALSTHIWFICNQALADQSGSLPLRQTQLDILTQLGYANSVQFAANQADLNRIRAANSGPTQTRVEQAEADEAAAADRLKKGGVWEYVRAVTLGDEIDLEFKTKEPELNAAFVADLKARGLLPDDFVLPQNALEAAGLPTADRWKLVKLLGPLPPSRPKLLFEAATFRYKLWSRDLAARTVQIRKLFPASVQTGANFSPHLSVWPDVRKWIDPFRDGAMTMPWSEDWWWQVPEAGPQAYGYLLDALRHAADYHNAPYCFYTIPDSGETASNLLRMNYFALGHQAKVIDHFAIYHQAYGTCDYIDYLDSKEKYRSIHRILTDVGKIDARLEQARLRKAQIAILMPVANDVWNNEDLLSEPKQEHTNNLYYADLNVENHERKALWLALRHAGYPVDLITDEDVAAGKLEGYKVLFAVGQEMLGAAVMPVKSWVHNGGILFGESGGGVLNEHREPQSEMLSLYGIKASHLRRPIRTLQPADDLPGMKPLGTIHSLTALVDFPAYCSQDAFEPADATIAGTWEDGRPAILYQSFGKGAAISCGALAGLAYIQPALVGKPELPTKFSSNILSIITSAVSLAEPISRPVLCSDALVDATLQEGSLGAVITLTRFRPGLPGKVTVTLPGLPNVKSVRSVRHGLLAIKKTPGGPQVTLLLDEGDFLLPE